MGLFDTLAKLGILRVGAKAGTYRNATERPTEFMMDNVFNAERDLVAGAKSGKDADQPATRFCTACGNKLADGARFCTSCGHPVG
ncbi:MAG: zinc ribbon domain-containing protein [Hyphomicrobiales bacterium]